MKFFNSIKWRLQLWYGLILVMVLLSFGITAYQLERNRHDRLVDDELHRRVAVLGKALHRPPPRAQAVNRPFSGGPPRGPEFRGPSFDGPPGPNPEDGQGEPGGQRPAKFLLSQDDARLFESDDPHGFYFLIFSREGEVMAGSTNQPEGVVREPVANPPDSGDPREARNRSRISRQFKYGNYREMDDQLPSGERIVAGCNVAPDSKELRRSAVSLTLVGGLVLMVGLAGGWWLVGRALRPVSEISATAVKIAAGDLSQRINLAEAESELGQLASVLNATFARLETAFAQQKQFASDAAHELRTPVTVILTQTQLALAREREAVSYRQTLEACERAAQRMRKLIESLLELARFDAGQEVLKRFEFDFSGTVFDCVDLVQPLAEDRAVRLVSELAPVVITGDSGRLSQVVTNLVTNAIQYNQPGGEVQVRLEMADGLAVLTVADSGPGIAPEDLPRVFDRFYRADKSRTGAGNSGLGLAICKAIIEAHGGTVEVYSEQGRGTVFTVRLPV